MSDHPQGWIKDPAAVEAIMQTLPYPVFQDVWQPIKGTGKGKVVLLYDIIRKVAGTFPMRTQTIGDCLNPTAMVRMADGTQKPIADIDVGEQVVTPYGNIKTVTNTICKPYNKKMVRIHVKGYHQPIEMTPDHLCMNLPNVKRGNKKDRNEIKWVPCVGLNKGDKILIPKMPSALEKVYDLAEVFPNLLTSDLDFKSLRLEVVKTDYVRAKGSKSQVKRFIPLNSKLGWLIGLFAAEGSYDNSRITFNLADHEMVFAKQIEQYMSELFDVEAKIYQVPSKPTVLYVRISNKVVADFFHVLCNGNTYTKTLLPELLIANQQAKLGILHGWLNGDGWKDQVGVSVSQDLIHNMYDIAISLGINASIVNRKPHKQSKASYSLNVNNATITSVGTDYRLKLSSKNMVSLGKAATIKQIEIVEPDTPYVYCLEVEDDHCFIADRYGVHNCVSHGAAYAVDAVKAVDIYLKKDFETWVAQTATEDIYAGSRVQIGGGRLGNGDGSIGAWAARYVNEYGALARQKYGSVDLSKYSGSRARSWGRANAGVPAALIPYAKKHPILTVSQVTNYEQCRDLIANGYAITIASNQGFSSARDSEGFARPQGSWAHQMCCERGTIIKGEFSKSIEDVQIGDLVYDINGDLQNVTEVYKRKYSGNVVKLSCSGREGLTLTPNHPVLVLRKTDTIPTFHTVDIALYANKDYKNSSKNSDYNLNKRVAQWVESKDLKVGDWLICPQSSKPVNKENIKWIESNKCKNKPNNIIMDDKFSWFLGLFAADGSSTKGHKIVITCNKKDEALIASCRKFIEENIGLTSYVKPYKNAIRVICYSSIVANTFYDWFGAGDQKRIPRFVISHCDYESFIKGFLDGDGTIINDGESFKITNCNKYMIEDLHTMMTNLKYSPYINKFSYKDKEYGNENWSDKYEIYWSNLKAKETNWWSENNYISRITDIQIESIEDDVFNLEVENTHTYIANGVVVHNCILAVDDEYKRPGVLVQNSWGIWNGGPKRHDQPDGSFWVDADEIERRILSQGDSWAFSGYQGFQPQSLNTRII